MSSLSAPDHWGLRQLTISPQQVIRCWYLNQFQAWVRHRTSEPSAASAPPTQTRQKYVSACAVLKFFPPSNKPMAKILNGMPAAILLSLIHRVKKKYWIVKDPRGIKKEWAAWSPERQGVLGDKESWATKIKKKMKFLTCRRTLYHPISDVHAYSKFLCDKTNEKSQRR